MQFEFTAFPRATEGTRREPPAAPHRARRPASSTAALTRRNPIELDHNALFHALRNESVPLVDPDDEARRRCADEGAAARRADASVQNEILHVDFQRVDENRKIHMKVPLHFINGEIAPAVEGDRRDHQPRHDRSSTSLCLPKDLPEFVEVDSVAHSTRRPRDPRVGPEAAREA